MKNNLMQIAIMHSRELTFIVLTAQSKFYDGCFTYTHSNSYISLIEYFIDEKTESWKR